MIKFFITIGVVLLAQISVRAETIPQIDVKPVSGGASNLNFYVQVDNHQLFLRVGTSIKDEYDNATEANKEGFSPEIVYYNPDLNIMLSRFLNATSWKFQWEQQDMVRKVVSKIREFHNSQVIFQNSFSPYEAIREYLHQLEGTSGLPPSVHEKIVPAVTRIQKCLGKPKSNTPCHLDFHMGNFLFENEKVWIVDWEFAAMGDPIFDLAVFSSTELIDPTHMKSLLATYMQKEPSEADLAYFRVMRFLADARWTLWTHSKLHTSNLDWDYAQDAENFIRSALHYLEENHLEGDLKKITAANGYYQ